MATHRTVLLAEADPELLDSLGFALRRRGYHVLATADGGRATGLLARQAPDVVVVGMLLPGRSGFAVARQAKERPPGTPVVMTAPTATAHADYALALGVDRFVARPFTPDEVAAAVEAVCPPPPARPPGSGSGSVPHPAPTRA